MERSSLSGMNDWPALPGAPEVNNTSEHLESDNYQKYGMHQHNRTATGIGSLSSRAAS